MLKLMLLGTPTITLNHNSLATVLTGKPLALLIHLAMTADLQARDLLAHLFWGELSNQQARNNLRYSLPDLRQVVADYLIITPQNIGFNRQQPYWLDVEVFRTALTQQKQTHNPAALQAALDLYRGDFLAGFRVRNAPDFEAWVTKQQEELRSLAVQGLQQLAELHLRQSTYDAGLATTQRLLALEPWHEAGVRLQMQFLAASDRRRVALTQYEQLRQALADELEIAPAPETTALYEQLRQGNLSHPGHRFVPPRPEPASPRQLGQAPKHNLPGQLTPLIGRRAEIAALSTQLLDPSCRLLTLMGEGGIGKTRLALAVAEILLAHFADGVWLVSLTDIMAEDNALERIAAVIGETLNVHFIGPERLTRQLFNHLRPRRLLLVLDNFEHLVEHADFVVEALRAAPNIKLLVTSRQRLDLQAEHLWRLAVLPFPSTEFVNLLTEDELLYYESAALFYERARRVRRTFQLNVQNRAAVAQICQLVDGLPLGIELAASLVNHYQCAEVVAILQENYAVLTSTQRDLPAQHRNMRTVLAASWRLLGAAEAEVLACCAVFRGSFSLEAAQFVAGATRALLVQIEGKSLIRQSEPGRYILHELVRQYALEQLQTTPKLYTRTLEQHSHLYITFLRAEGERLHIDAQAQQRLRLEQANIQSAWQWAVDHLQLAAIKISLSSLVRFYSLAGYYTVGLRLCEQTEAQIRPFVDAHRLPQPTLQQLLADLLLARADFCHHLGRLDEANTFAQNALTLGQQLAMPEIIGQAYYEMAEVARVSGQFEAAVTAAQQAWALARQAAQFDWEAACLNRLGNILITFSDFTRATDYLEIALLLLQTTPDRVLEARLRINLGYTAFWRRDMEAALVYDYQAYELTHLFGDQRGLSHALAQLGMVFQALGQFEKARDFYEQARTIVHAANLPFFEGRLLLTLGILSHDMGDYELAHQHLTQALHISRLANSAINQYFVLHQLGYVWIALQQFEEAARAFHQALALLEPMKQPIIPLDIYAGRAELFLAQNELANALAQIEEVLTHLTDQNLRGAIRDNWVYWTSYRVLQATNDARAPAILEQAYQYLEEKIATIQDEQLRRSFWENVPIQRALLAAAQAAGIA